MPEMTFTVQWPDGQTSRCYSPSLVVREHLESGKTYPVEDFVARSRVALIIASDRVREKFGVACTAAMSQLEQIEQTAADFDAAARVTVLELT